ncbi:MAG: MarR family winged helix-turn-helix transcriptional regulator [Gallionellaceae bacterium]
MPQKSFIPLLRELARAYQAFEAYSAAHVRTLGLTPSQFDIVATLGNTDGMSFKELGEKTLITKGTLTGVVDRLQFKNLVKRVASPSDRRSQIVKLTRKGEALFDRVFPAHMSHVDQAFTGLSQAELDGMESVLQRLRAAFYAANVN